MKSKKTSSAYLCGWLFTRRVASSNKAEATVCKGQPSACVLCARRTRTFFLSRGPGWSGKYKSRQRYATARNVPRTVLLAVLPVNTADTQRAGLGDPLQLEDAAELSLARGTSITTHWC